MIEQQMAAEARSREVYHRINRRADPDHPTELDRMGRTVLTSSGFFATIPPHNEKRR
ncbi:MAG: hypothetical protein M1305_07080 [Candidatus Marsarchaeota archaeon]|nr:hypothetical protein [Candidatus Marsarchaeota archaeon]